MRVINANCMFCCGSGLVKRPNFDSFIWDEIPCPSCCRAPVRTPSQEGLKRAMEKAVEALNTSDEESAKGRAA